MNRIDQILTNQIFQENLEKNQELEKDRIFCKHQMEHFLDVARIGMIINLEETYGLNKELIYAVAFLHDIGKNRQYEEGISHELASASIAPEILKACGFSEDEIAQIVEAILNHRKPKDIEEKSLSELLYRADKASRACFDCQARKECNWSDEKKNLTIKY